MALARVTREFAGEGARIHRVGELIAMGRQHSLLTSRGGFAVEDDEGRERVACACGREFINSECMEAHREQDGCETVGAKGRVKAVAGA